MLKQEDLQAEMLISAEAKRLADRYNKDYLDCEDLMKISFRLVGIREDTPSG